MSVELMLPAPFQVGDATFVAALFGADDLEAIFTLERRSHPHPWTLENLRSSLASHTCIGLRHGDNWVAHAVLSFVVGEAELLLFVIDKAWQGRGVGTRFLEVLAQAAKQKAQTLFLEVRASNEAAVALYEKAGFNQVGLRPGYYPSRSGREDALLYALDLTFWEP
jgi:ribosomal-protein-alanine N-acetyltransferase